MFLKQVGALIGRDLNFGNLVNGNPTDPGKPGEAVEGGFEGRGSVRPTEMANGVQM